MGTENQKQAHSHSQSSGPESQDDWEVCPGHVSLKWRISARIPCQPQERSGRQTNDSLNSYVPAPHTSFLRILKITLVGRCGFLHDPAKQTIPQGALQTSSGHYRQTSGPEAGEPRALISPGTGTVGWGDLIGGWARAQPQLL